MRILLVTRSLNTVFLYLFIFDLCGSILVDVNGFQYQVAVYLKKEIRKCAFKCLSKHVVFIVTIFDQSSLKAPGEHLPMLNVAWQEDCWLNARNNVATRVKNEHRASYICGHEKTFCTRVPSQRSRAFLVRNPLGYFSSTRDLRISVSGAVVRDNSIKVMLAAA